MFQNYNYSLSVRQKNLPRELKKLIQKIISTSPFQIRYLNFTFFKTSVIFLLILLSFSRLSATPYDISSYTSGVSIALSVAGQENAPTTMLFNNDGTVLYVMGNTGDDINEYTLSTAYDISTASFNQIALDVSGEETAPSAMLYNNDGTVLYVLGLDGDDINAYPLPAALPVDLVFFRAETVERDAVLTWHTQTEINNAGFEILRYVQGDWEVADFVTGAGHSFTTQNYQRTIYDLSAGSHLFRLRQIDFDGRIEYSNIEEVWIENFQNLPNLKITPNPVQNGAVTLYLPEKDFEEALWNHFGIQAKEIHSTDFES